MLKLRKRPTITVELPAGVTITAAPIGAADIDLAVLAIRRRLGAAADAAEGLARYGVAGPDVEPGGEGVALALYGVPQSLLAIELGIRHIRAWTGVGTDADEDVSAPVDPGFVARLFNEWVPAAGPGEPLNFGRAWLMKMLAQSTLEPGGPKGSAASPGTSTAAAAMNAGSAATSASDAPTGVA